MDNRNIKRNNNFVLNKVFLVVIIFLVASPFILSQEDSCSYPSSVDCTNRDDLGKVIQEWTEGKCSRDAVDKCTSIWENPEEDESESETENSCVLEWECDSWGSCEDGKNQRICNDGCGKEKIETQECSGEEENPSNDVEKCEPKWDCEIFGACEEGKTEMMCEDGCGNEKIAIERCTRSGEDAKTYIEEWDCGENWGICTEGHRTQVCYDSLGREKVNYKDCSQSYPEDYPIVFVHGWLGDSNSFDEFKEKMVQDNYIIDYSNWYKYNKEPPYRMQMKRKSLVILDTTYSYELEGEDYCALKYGIEEHARKLDDHIEKIKESANVEKVNIVAHSMGGLTTRYYIQNYGGYDSVNKVVTLGTPHEGAERYTDLGSQFYSSIKQNFWKDCPEESFDESAEQLSSNSNFIYNLNLQNDYSGYVDYYAIFTGYDELVSSESAELDFAKINYPDTLCSTGFPRHNSLRKPSQCLEAYEYTLDALGFKDTEIPPHGKNNMQEINEEEKKIKETNNNNPDTLLEETGNTVSETTKLNDEKDETKTDVRKIPGEDISFFAKIKNFFLSIF